MPPKAAQGGQGSKRRRTPKSVVVTLTCEDGSYAEVMRAVRSKISLTDLGIADLRVRTGVTGARVLEIPGEGSHAKADVLRDRMVEAIGQRAGVRIARPSKTADILIVGLEDSSDSQEIARAISTAGGCTAADVKVGAPKTNNRRVISAWARCPVGAANKLSAAGTLTVGWARTRVMPLAARPMQCYRCLEKGHTRASCKAPVDRSGCCYRCGMAGHTAAVCSAPAQCVICRERGAPSNHRWGGPACKPPKAKGGVSRGISASQASLPAAPKGKEKATPAPVEAPLMTPVEEPKPRRSKRIKKGKAAPPPESMGGSTTAHEGQEETPMEVEISAPLQTGSSKELVGLEEPIKDLQCS